MIYIYIYEYIGKYMNKSLYNGKPYFQIGIIYVYVYISIYVCMALGVESPQGGAIGKTVDGWLPKKVLDSLQS